MVNQLPRFTQEKVIFVLEGMWPKNKLEPKALTHQPTIESLNDILYKTHCSTKVCAKFGAVVNQAHRSQRIYEIYIYDI